MLLEATEHERATEDLTYRGRCPRPAAKLDGGEFERPRNSGVGRRNERLQAGDEYIRVRGGRSVAGGRRGGLVDDLDGHGAERELCAGREQNAVQVSSVAVPVAAVALLLVLAGVDLDLDLHDGPCLSDTCWEHDVERTVLGGLKWLDVLGRDDGG